MAHFAGRWPAVSCAQERGSIAAQWSECASHGERTERRHRTRRHRAHARMRETTMSEWKSWSKQFERDMREAAASVRAAVTSSDIDEVAAGATDFARTIAECAVAPIAAFLSGLPRSMDFEWKGAGRRADGREWNDEA